MPATVGTTEHKNVELDEIFVMFVIGVIEPVEPLGRRFGAKSTAMVAPASKTSIFFVMFHQIKPGKALFSPSKFTCFMVHSVDAFETCRTPTAYPIVRT